MEGLQALQSLQPEPEPESYFMKKYSNISTLELIPTVKDAKKELMTYEDYKLACPHLSICKQCKESNGDPNMWQCCSDWDCLMTRRYKAYRKHTMFNALQIKETKSQEIKSQEIKSQEEII